jgi:acetylornithine deacetylase/succinyl-diaminopimelate desuccinylase-like protein
MLEFTPINTYGILLEWKGKDESLKPYLFMAHQDVVPVLKVLSPDGHTHPIRHITMADIYRVEEQRIAKIT